MKLTKRLQSIANLIEYSSGIADVGCDHGKILLYALKNNLTGYVVASDISEKSLQKAVDLLNQNNYKNYKAIVSDGFNNYSLNDIDSIETFIISGLGGYEIVKIMQELITRHNVLFKQFILQPQNNEVFLKEFLINANFNIESDFIVKDYDKFYTIIKCQRTDKLTKKLNKKELQFGKTNLNSPTQDFIEYLNYEINKTQNIVEQTSKKVKKQMLNKLKNYNKILNIAKKKMNL